MSKWGVFENTQDRTRHIIPSSDEGLALPPHRVSTDCGCAPKLKEGFHVHNDPEHGGFNT